MKKYNCLACLDDWRTPTKNKCYACWPDYPQVSLYKNDLDFMSWLYGSYISCDELDHQDPCWYYGRLNVKPKLGLIYMVLDDHVKNIIDKQAQKFIDSLGDILKEFKEELLAKMKDIDRERKSSHTTLKDEIKFLTDKVNKLAEKKESKPKPKAVKEKDSKEYKEVFESLKKKGVIKKQK